MADFLERRLHAELSLTIATPSPKLSLEGAPNFRDLACLPAVDGRRVRPRVLFRSEGPAHFNTQDAAALRALDIRTVCDLRSDGERRAHPNSWCDEGRLLEIDIDIDVRVSGNKAWDLLRRDPTATGARDAMRYSYRAMGRTMERPFRRLVDHLLVTARVPLLIHCTGGKDRTGVMTALLLHALGVAADEIKADYLLSTRYTGGARFAEGLSRMFDELGIVDPPPELTALIIGVELSYLEAAMEEILRGTTTLERFFDERIGLDRSRRAALQDIFLETPPWGGEPKPKPAVG